MIVIPVCGATEVDWKVAYDYPMRASYLLQIGGQGLPLDVTKYVMWKMLKLAKTSLGAEFLVQIV
jgi:hypothetical protein